MTKDQIKAAELMKLIVLYREAATQNGEATEQGDHRAANIAADTLATIYSELRIRGAAAQRQLLPLLVDPAPGVRVWAGSHALEFSPTEGEEALANLVSERSLIGFIARTTLREWREGRLRFP